MSNDAAEAGGGSEADKKKQLIRNAMSIFEEKLQNKEIKVTPGEYIRLLELLQQIDGDEPREIKITWVDQTETEPCSET